VDFVHNKKELIPQTPHPLEEAGEPSLRDQALDPSQGFFHIDSFYFAAMVYVEPAFRFISHACM
jgi:hypothetical protein